MRVGEANGDEESTRDDADEDDPRLLRPQRFVIFVYDVANHSS